MNKYPLKELGHGIEIKHGFAFKGEFFSGEGEKIVLTPGNFYDEGGFKYTPGKEKFYTGEIPEDYICSKGDLIVAMTEQTPGLLGSTALVPEDEKFLHNQRIGLITFDNQKYDKLFLNYLFRTKSVRDQIALSSSGTKVKHTSPKRIYEVLAPKPPLDKQQKIGALLHSLDSKIELNNKINAELEAMAKLIYDYWFVQFDFPISAEQAAAMGKPELEGKPYKASGGPMVYNTQLKREIPEGWDIDSISSWIEHDKSGDWGKEELNGNYSFKVSCIRGADINGLNGKGKIKAPIRFIHKNNKHKKLNEGDLIVEISGGSPTQSTGRLAYINEATLERFPHSIICSNFCRAISLKDKYSFYNFILMWNRLYEAGVFFGWEGKTSGIKNFLFDSFASRYLEVKPPSDLMKSYFDKASPMFDKIQRSLIENQKLSELRDWLLPMLMNGQVSIEEAEEYADSYQESMAAEPEEGYGN
ncbi:restriction endonuclease subunit S [Roseivirga sp. UBA1976]|uniref:restriction endonuclease subunit S n=1 Tax=Roseivirga sp. UBA1976 TaxID=1947386 RepID=UPI00257F8E25|nr:restriction endonuclease subunit S [Roseivirga sp. UBA1976]MEC7753227.1 restriction endonuclease subunit S [Bacteroidota bacterium]|tara:strand:- start:1341 stop:2756 length:1416 start_codon:yes stop_codon:yes gene_type:complete